MNPRQLKVEADGDPWHSKPKPKIRLMGRWLEEMGFPPGRHVEVSPIEPGVLQLKLKTQGCEQASASNSHQPKNGEQCANSEVHSFEHCVTRIGELKQELRTAFGKGWREYCRREIAEWEAYVAEHYPNHRRSELTGSTPSLASR